MNLQRVFEATRVHTNTQTREFWIYLWIYYWLLFLLKENKLIIFAAVSQMAEPSLPRCQRLVSALKQANLYSSAGPGPAGQTIYTARHKHLKLGLNLIYCYSLPVVWHLMSPKTLLVIGLIHKYELLFLCCLIIKRIKFCLWPLFIISKGNIIHRCLTLKTRHSLKFSCNTNTQDGTNTQLQTCIAHTHTLFPPSPLLSFTHRQTHILVSHSLVSLLFGLLGGLWPWLGWAGWTLGPDAAPTGSSPT